MQAHIVPWDLHILNERHYFSSKNVSFCIIQREEDADVPFKKKKEDADA